MRRRHKKKRGRASKRREKKKKKTANTPATTTTTTTGFRLVLEDGSCFEEKRWERFEERERERERSEKFPISILERKRFFKRERAESVVVVVV